MSNKNDNNTSHSPQLRFPEFTGEWKEKKLGDCLDYEQPQEYLVESDNYVSNGIPVLTAGKTFILGYTKEKEGVFNNLPVIIFDDFTTASKFVDFPFKAKSSAMKMLLPKKDVNLRFVYESMQLVKYQADDHKRHWISFYSNIPILLPPSPAEQQKIADCLSSLDDMIRAEGQKTEALREYKRGLMQQLFPANGATTPQLRFPGFTGEWKEKKLGEVCDRITEKVGNALLEPISVSANVGIISQKQRFGKNISGEQYKNYIRIKKGDYCYNKGNSKCFPQGCIYELQNFEEAAAPNAFINFRFRNFVVPHFFNGYFDKNAHGKQLIQYITSGARSDGLLNLNVEDFFKIKFLLPPSLAEQQKIADCLSSLDDMITAQANKTETLREYKRGLMQQLFPQPSK